MKIFIVSSLYLTEIFQLLPTWLMHKFGTFKVAYKLVRFDRELFHCNKLVSLVIHPACFSFWYPMRFSFPLNIIMSFFHVFVDTFGIKPRRSFLFVSSRNKSELRTRDTLLRLSWSLHTRSIDLLRSDCV